MPRKKIFSVCKLNTLKALEESANKPFKNPINLKRSGSIAHLKKIPLPPALNIDYADVYMHITKLIASSYGITVVNEGPNKVRRGKVDLGNNGQLIKQTLKKRIWWTVSNEDAKTQEIESSVNFMWTQHPLSRRNL